jgi:hypothetical protein
LAVAVELPLLALAVVWAAELCLPFLGDAAQPLAVPVSRPMAHNSEMTRRTSLIFEACVGIFQFLASMGWFSSLGGEYDEVKG